MADKIVVIREIRQITGCGLKHAKDAVEKFWGDINLVDKAVEWVIDQGYGYSREQLSRVDTLYDLIHHTRIGRYETGRLLATYNWNVRDAYVSHMLFHLFPMGIEDE